MTALTVVMICAVLVLIVLFVTRFPTVRSGPVLPEAIKLGENEVAGAVTQGTGWLAVVVTGADGAQSIVVFDADGHETQRVAIEK